MKSINLAELIAKYKEVGERNERFNITIEGSTFMSEYVVECYNLHKHLIVALEQAQKKLDDVADRYKASEHKNKLLNMALRAANNGNDTTDFRYSYDPLQGACQLKTLCHGVVVHIPVDWLTEIIDNKNSVIDGLQQQNQQIGHKLNFARGQVNKLQETYTDENGFIWETPTSWAYAQACNALHKHTEQERVLRDALENILNYTEPTCVVKTSSEIIDIMRNFAREALKLEGQANA